MKYQFDLLPNEYKCLPKNNLEIVIGAIAMMICVSAIVTLYLKNNRDIAGLRTQMKDAQTSVENIYSEMRSPQYQSPADKIMTLKNTIEFINKNLETPGTSWVDFLFTFEQTVPEKVYVKDINPKDFAGTVSDFTVQGEAESIYDILKFISNLQKSEKFDNVFLKQNAMQTTGKTSMVNFSLSFTFKRKVL